MADTKELPKRSILDDFGREFNRIDKVEYERICELLDYLWNAIKSALDFSNSSEQEIFSEYISKIFNPKRLPATRLEIIEKLPSIDVLKSKFDPSGETLEKLEKSKAIEPILRPDVKRVILTPEGVGLRKSLQKSSQLDNRYSPNGFVLRNFEKELFLNYRELIFQKISDLNVQEQLLSPREIGIVLFFFFNGSIGEKNPFIPKIQELNRAVNCFVSAFSRARELTEEERTNVKIKVLEMEIPQLQKKIFNGIYNQKRKFFIKNELTDRLRELLNKSVCEKIMKNKEQRWSAIKKEYERWRTTLQLQGVCFYKKTNEIELEKIFSNGSTSVS